MKTVTTMIAQAMMALTVLRVLTVLKSFGFPLIDPDAMPKAMDTIIAMRRIENPLLSNTSWGFAYGPTR